MIELLAGEPMLLLGIVLALGSMLGAIPIRGTRIGPAGALFVGLLVSAIDPRLVISSIVGVVGLALFTYCIGLTTGPDFVRGLKPGLPLMLGVGTILMALGFVVYALGSVGGLSPGRTAGLYAGALTNTPALAGAQALLPASEAGEPVVTYALAYPFGVLGMIGAVIMAFRLFASPDELTEQGFESFSIRVGRERPDQVGAMTAALGSAAVIARIYRDDRQFVPLPGDELLPNDVISLTCHPEDSEEIAGVVGEMLDLDLTDDRSQLDFRRMVVTNPAVVGRTLGDLALTQRHGATITRVRRSGRDVLAYGGTVLEPGDRVRVVAPPDQLPLVAAVLGDDENRASEFSPVGFTLGLSLGIAAGIVPLSVPGAGSVELGVAGGPLLVGLILGWQERTGPLIWQVPAGVSTTLRQIGQLLFLGMAGTSGGAAMRAAIRGGDALSGVGLGLIVTTLAAVLLLLLARWRGLDGPSASGLIAGAQTQPAVLAFSVDRSVSPQVVVHYALALPAAMVVKIVVGQLLVLL